MRTVAIEEFKDHLDEYLRVVQTGEGVLITSRGELVAELRARGQERPTPEGLKELVRRGMARGVVRNDPSRYRTFERALPHTTAQDLLDWDRGQR